ncbi:hypothetical protein FRC08_001522 [Ceratobasidium sp. 394]|nr:hypothetical protein FRC08_001522 [Ceratobasidium sp. 394]
MGETRKQSFELGVKAFRRSEYQDAINHFTRSIAFDDTKASVFESRAAAFQRVFRFREALADTRKCIALQPDWYRGYYRAARVFLALSEREKCVKLLGEARRRMNSPDASITCQLDEMEVDTYEDLQITEIYHRNHVNLLKKLPLELLVEVCTIAVDASDVEAGLRGASHFAVALGSVCRPLRALVHKTPSLWHCVTFTGKYFAQKSSFWLERLDGFPLFSVTLAWINLQAIPQVVETLVSTRPQLWKCLRLEGDNLDTPRLYNALRAFGLRLHSLAILCPPNSKPPEASIVVNPKGLVPDCARFQNHKSQDPTCAAYHCVLEPSI